MRICPKCRAFSADPQLAFCLADGTPLRNVTPQSDKWNEGTRVIEEQAKRLSKRSRRLRWRKIALASMMTLVMTTVVFTSFSVETTTSTPDVSPVPLPKSSPTAKLSSLPSDSPSPTPSPSLSVLPTPTPTPTPVYKISGVVSSTGQPLSGVEVELSGTKKDSTKTDPNGRYAFSGLRAGGNYTVTPRHLQIVFLPASRTFSLSKDESADFPADVVKISGRVTQNGRPLSRVKLSLQGSKSAAEFTNNDGYYSFGNLRAGGSYTVIPRSQETEPAQKFDPPSAGFENLRRDDTAEFKVRNDPPPDCLERNMNREAEEVFRSSSSRLRETIDKDERERAAIRDKYGEGAKHVELSVGPLQPGRIRFLEPCKVFVITGSYPWQVTFPGNAVAPPRTKQVQKTRDFTCEKRKDGWQCR